MNWLSRFFKRKPINSKVKVCVAPFKPQYVDPKEYQINKEEFGWFLEAHKDGLICYGLWEKYKACNPEFRRYIESEV